MTYVSWGLIEDKILNAEFGHGDGLDAITSSDKEDFQISIDSSKEESLVKSKSGRDIEPFEVHYLGENLI